MTLLDEQYSAPIGEEEYEEEYTTEDAPLDEVEGDGAYVPISRQPTQVNFDVTDKEFDRQGKISLHRKIAAVQMEIAALPATGQNARGKAATDSNDVLNTVRPVCASHGLTIIVSQSTANYEVVERVSRDDYGKEKMNRVMQGEVLATLTLTCTDTGYSEQYNYFMVAEHINGYQAIQIATKFAARLLVATTFCLAEGGGNGGGSPTPKKPPVNDGRLSPAKVNQAKEAAKASGYTATGRKNLLATYKIATIEDLDWKKFDSFLAECQDPKQAEFYNNPG